MRRVARIVSLVVTAACGRVGFDDTRDSGTGFDVIVDASPCVASAVDWASWPIPNNVGSGLPNIASRTAMGAIVKDNVTGLEWERSVVGGMKTWADAAAYCASLATSGPCWRLPQRIELASIVDYAGMFPSIDAAFATTPVAPFWTATAVASAPGQRWVVNFDIGYIQRADETMAAAMVRCVRGAQDPLPRYQVSTGGGVVTDTKTGLTWQRMNVGTYNWGDARTYCSQLVLEGGGWRSPSIQELESLVDTTQNTLLIDAAMFPGTPGSMFWSGSGIQNDATMGWTIDFSQGYAFRPITAMLPTRCVRP